MTYYTEKLKKQFKEQRIDNISIRHNTGEYGPDYLIFIKAQIKDYSTIDYYINDFYGVKKLHTLEREPEQIYTKEFYDKVLKVEEIIKNDSQTKYFQLVIYICTDRQELRHIMKERKNMN